MSGCRGRPEEVEGKVWQAIEAYRRRLPVPPAQLRALRTTARQLQDRAEELPQEGDDLRRQASRMLATFDRLMEAGR